MLVTKKIIVSGKVQGVFYRQSTRQKALEFGVTGTVKNKADSTVEIMVTGKEDALQQLVNWCRQGPPLANVFGVEIIDQPIQTFNTFTII